MSDYSNKYQEYFNHYNDYSSIHILGQKYLEQGIVISKSLDHQLLYYEGSVHKKLFLVIPSIFNSPEILFLSKDTSFIDNLREQGDVFLIDWLEVNNGSYLLEDYVKTIIKLASNLGQKNNIPLHLIGHCLGGNLALATCVLSSRYIKSLTLLTTPWDFSYLAGVSQLHQYLNLDSSVQNLSIVPKIHIQILFFLLFPNYFHEKIDKFFILKSVAEKDLFFRIENWLMSGTALPQAAYRQIMHDIITNNIFANMKWKIDNILIDPASINAPVYQIVANKDQLVPYSSILPLQKLFKNSKLIEVENGHISYLINNDSKLKNLFMEYE